MKKIIYMTILILSFLGCKPEVNPYLLNHNVIFYNTDAFSQFEANAKIKIKEAANIQIEFANDNNTKPQVYLYFVIDDYYVFGSFVNEKKPYGSTRGIWIDSKTGEAKIVKEEVLLTAYDFYKIE